MEAFGEIVNIGGHFFSGGSSGNSGGSDGSDAIYSCCGGFCCLAIIGVIIWRLVVTVHIGILINISIIISAALILCCIIALLACILLSAFVDRDDDTNRKAAKYQCATLAGICICVMCFIIIYFILATASVVNSPWDISNDSEYGWNDGYSSNDTNTTSSPTSDIEILTCCGCVYGGNGDGCDAECKVNICAIRYYSYCCTDQWDISCYFQTRDVCLSGTLYPTISASPTVSPTEMPTISPTINPSVSPTETPSQITMEPTISPSDNPTSTPTNLPSKAPSVSPTQTPTEIPTMYPTKKPSLFPTETPSEITMEPTVSPSDNPTPSPTTLPSKAPTINPTKSPTTANPTNHPTLATLSPTMDPTIEPTFTPSTNPTKPTMEPTSYPSDNPTSNPTNVPTNEPTYTPEWRAENCVVTYVDDDDTCKVTFLNGNYYKYTLKSNNCPDVESAKCIYDDSNGKSDCELWATHDQGDSRPCWVYYENNECVTCDCSNCDDDYRGSSP